MNKSTVAALLAGIIGAGGIATAAFAVPNSQFANNFRLAQRLENEVKVSDARQAKITIQQAIAIAEAEIGGKASEVELDNEDGNLVYEVEIGEKEVVIDAVNGKVLYTESESGLTTIF